MEVAYVHLIVHVHVHTYIINVLIQIQQQCADRSQTFRQSEPLAERVVECVASGEAWAWVRGVC